MERLVESMRLQLRRVGKVLAFGYILFYFSELVFWGQIRPEDSLQNWLTTWLAYSIVGWIVLTVMEHFRIRTFHGVFLAGALFGWLAEGVLVQTVYEDLPLSISFTGLAWHALISLCGGWLWLRRQLRKSWSRMAVVSVMVGAAYGLWAICWWVEDPFVIYPPDEFLPYSVVSTLIIIGAYQLLESVDFPLRAGRGIKALQVLLVAGFFALGSALTHPVSILVFPVLMLTVFLPLQRNRSLAETADAYDFFEGAVQPGKYWTLLLLPLTASLVYGLAHAAGIRFPTHWIVYLVTTPLGFYLFARSAWKTWHHPGW